ncbi:hypothetical protein OY671_009615, partial [Metschnikowia pulcherrima]
PRLDDSASLDASQSPAFYVGAIGSRRNSGARRARSREHFGSGDADSARLRGPAGLYIGSKTPAEIALSIMAEIVAAKNGVARGALDSVAAGKARDYNAARAIHDRSSPVTKAVYHRGSHMEGTCALKLGLVARGKLDHATVRSPLVPSAAGAEKEIHDALAQAGSLAKVAAAA